MKASIEERQMELTMRRNERNRLMRRVEGALEQLREAKVTRDRLHAQLTKEQQDVAELGKFSIVNKFNAWRGKWDEQMEKEMAEALDAEVKFNEAEKIVYDLEIERNDYLKQLQKADFSFVDEEWEEFLIEKELWIRQNDSIAAQTLQRIADERVTLRSLLREIEEAREAGQTAKRTIETAIDKLNSAEGMSIWDTFLGGGMIVSALKYSEVNASEDYIHRAQRALRHFETELKDVQNVAADFVKVNQNDLLTFTDLFFDNIFSDWMVHNRITDAKKSMEGLIQDVLQALRQLTRKKDEVDQQLERLDQEEQRVILS